MTSIVYSAIIPEYSLLPIITFDTVKPTKSDTTVLYIRDAPIALARKLRAAAALAGYRGIPDYVIEVLEKHTEELERKGSLPKSK